MAKIDQIKWEDSLKIQLTKLAQGKRKLCLLNIISKLSKCSCDFIGELKTI